MGDNGTAGAGAGAGSGSGSAAASVSSGRITGPRSGPMPASPGIGEAELVAQVFTAVMSNALCPAAKEGEAPVPGQTMDPAVRRNQLAAVGILARSWASHSAAAAAAGAGYSAVAGVDSSAEPFADPKFTAPRASADARHSLAADLLEQNLRDLPRTFPGDAFRAVPPASITRLASGELSRHAGLTLPGPDGAQRPIAPSKDVRARFMRRVSEWQQLPASALGTLRSSAALFRHIGMPDGQAKLVAEDQKSSVWLPSEELVPIINEIANARMAFEDDHHASRPKLVSLNTIIADALRDLLDGLQRIAARPDVTMEEYRRVLAALHHQIDLFARGESAVFITGRLNSDFCNAFIDMKSSLLDKMKSAPSWFPRPRDPAAPSAAAAGAPAADKPAMASSELRTEQNRTEQKSRYLHTH